jgi:hypothetical protein
VIAGDAPGRTIAALIISGLVVPAACWVLLGMPGEQCLFIAAVGVAIAALVRFPPDGFDIGFPEPPDPVRDRGTRREAFRLSWNVAGRQDRVGSTLINRLQQVAARRLAEHGLDLTDPANRDRVIARLDPTSYRLLTLPPGSDASTRAFNHTLAVVERLAEAGRTPLNQPSNESHQLASHQLEETG